MKKWTLLDESRSRDGKVFTLHEHDGTYSIRVDGAELMSTRRHASEDKLADIACAPVASRDKPRALIGGLGFGFTLRAALRSLPRDAKVVVAELMPCVIAWNKNEAWPLAAKELADPRVELFEGDVGDALTRNPGGFDAIMLDVDNGPDALSAAGNARLYHERGLQAAREALRPGGLIVYWSAHVDPGFEKLLRKAGFAVETERVRAHATSGGWHTLFVCKRMHSRP